MTARIAILREQRAQLTKAYAWSRRRHLARAALAEWLRDVTTALLRAELRAARAKPRKATPAKAREAAPDLFATH